MVSTSHTSRGGITKHSEGAVNTIMNEEETLIETVGLAEISGWVSLKNMEEGKNMEKDDEVTIKSYAKIGPRSDFELHESSTYRGKQTESSFRFLDFAGCYGIKITLTQTEGTPRTYPYLFFKKG